MVLHNEQDREGRLQLKQRGYFTAISLLSHPILHSNIPHCHTQYFTAISPLSHTILHSNIPSLSHTQYFTAISPLSHTILHSNIPTLTHNSRHYTVQTTGSCNTPRFISSQVIELPIQSVATNTDFSSRLFMSCFAADIAVVVQTNWYCQLYIRQWTGCTACYNRI
jgi:hypothetical protein